MRSSMTSGSPRTTGTRALARHSSTGPATGHENAGIGRSNWRSESGTTVHGMCTRVWVFVRNDGTWGNRSGEVQPVVRVAKLVSKVLNNGVLVLGRRGEPR